ncbi:hypothetical protein E0663_17285 [Salmonella enterica subsp. enterica]|nr:hypothetical protein [Salmonella enterica subsp. enterica]
MEDSSFFWLVSGIPAIIGLCLGYIICHVRNKEPHPDLIYIKKRLQELTDAHEKASDKIIEKLSDSVKTSEFDEGLFGIGSYMGKTLGTIDHIFENVIEKKLDSIQSKLDNMEYRNKCMEEGVFNDFEYVKKIVHDIDSSLEYSWVCDATFRRQALASILTRLDKKYLSAKNRVMYKKILDKKIEDEIDLIFDKSINAVEEHSNEKTAKMFKQVTGRDLN